MTPVESPVKRMARGLYERRGYAWVLALYVLLLHLAATLMTGPGRGWPEKVAGAGLIGGVAVLGWIAMRPHGDHRAQVLVPFLGGLLVAAALARSVVGYVFIPMLLLACAFAFRYLPARWGVAVSLVAIAIPVGVQVLPPLLSSSPVSLADAVTHSAWMFFPILIIGWIAQLSRVSGERQRVIDELHATQGRLVAAERQEGVLEERARLAREIHDTLAQGLVSIVMHLEAAEQSAASDSAAALQHLDQARRAARDNLAEARRFVWALQPPALERDALPTALANVAERWSEENDIPVAVSVTGEVRSLPPESEVTLLRAAQEALANVARHAQAHQVNLTLSYMDDQVAMDVNDDGVGFDLARVGADGSADTFGLEGMRQRVERSEGRLSIESAVGEGTTVAVVLPILSSERN